MDQFKALRELSLRAFGPSTETVKVELNGSLETLVGVLSGTFRDPSDAEDLVCEFPFLERMFHSPVTRPPPPPVLNPDCLEQALTNYLRACRLYRKKFPTYDRATKLNQKNPTRSSTHVKFDLGLDTTGSVHVGAGRIIASSVPNASRFIDWMQGSDAFLEDFEESLIVSDMAIPDEDGLGCGCYPALCVRISGWVDEGKQVVAKLNILDYWRLCKEGLSPAILYKPRKHNLELIAGFNIPSVGLDEYAILEDIIAENIRRNEAIYEQNLPIEDFEEVHIECFSDEKDYASMVEGLDFSQLAPYGVDREEHVPPTPEALEQHINAGMATWHDVVDAKAMMTLKNAVTEYEEGTPYEPPEHLIEEYEKWDDVYKRPRTVPLVQRYASGFQNVPTVMVMPLARICTAMHLYGIEKTVVLYQVLVLHQLAQLKFRKRGETLGLDQLYALNADRPRN